MVHLWPSKTALTYMWSLYQQAINWIFKLPLFTFQRHRNCIPDEHYVQTLLAVSRMLSMLFSLDSHSISWSNIAIRNCFLLSLTLCFFNFENVIKFDCPGCWDHISVYHLQILVHNFYFLEFHSTSSSVSCDKISGLDNELERRAVTYTLWNQSTLEGKIKSWHPLTFDYADAAPQKLRQIKVSSLISLQLVVNTTMNTSNNASKKKKTNHNLACS